MTAARTPRIVFIADDLWAFPAAAAGIFDDVRYVPFLPFQVVTRVSHTLNLLELQNPDGFGGKRFLHQIPHYQCH